MDDILIRGGTVVDGTGADAIRADVRVRDGVIAEVGADLATGGEPVVDASGAFVTPGIIDTHTHLDGAMWWNPALDPLPSYGNTSMVFGNCGNSIAPLAGEQRDEIVDLLCFLEDLPLEAFRREVPWTWEDWPEYATALAGQPTTVNVGGYLGHLSLRTYVMGADTLGARGDARRGRADGRAARRRSRRRRHGTVGQPLRQGPGAPAGARVLRRRRRVPRAVWRRRPASSRHGADDHALQRSRARRGGRRALRSPVPARRACAPSGRACP